MRAIMFVWIPALAVSAAAARPKPAEPPKTSTGPAIVVQVLPVRPAPKDPLLLHVRVSVPPFTSLAVFCRAVSQAASIPVESAADLADQKLMAEVWDQPLGRVLEDVAALMNARLVKEPHDTGQAHYRILQFKVQREAEGEIVGFPVQRLLAGLQALRDGKDPAGLPPEVAQFAKKRPGFLSVLRKLPDAQWGQLLDGQNVPVTDAALLALIGSDLGSEATSLRNHAANAGLKVPEGGADVARASLEVNDQANGMAPTLHAQVQFSDGGSLGAGLVSQTGLQALFPDDRRLRKLLNIPPSPNPLPASPEIDLSGLQPEVRVNDVVAEIARRAHLDLIQRQFRYPYPALPPAPSLATYDRKAPALELLAEIWKYEPMWGQRDGIIVAAPIKWPFERQEIPDEKLDRWLAAADRRQLSIDHLIEMAQLTDPQLLRLESFFMGPVIEAIRSRKALRAWAALNSLQQQAASGPEGLVLRTLNDAVRQSLVRLATDRGARDPTQQPDAILSATRSPRQFRISLAGVGIRQTELARVLTPQPRQYYPPGLREPAKQDSSKKSKAPSDDPQSKSKSF